MANKKLTTAPVASALTSDVVLYGVQAGVTKQVPASLIVAAVLEGVGGDEASETIGATTATGNLTNTTEYSFANSQTVATSGNLTSVSINFGASPAGTFRLYVVASGTVLWVGDYTHSGGLHVQPITGAAMPAGSRLYISAVGISYSVGGNSHYFNTAEYNGSLGDAVSEQANPVTIAMAFTVSSSSGGSIGDIFGGGGAKVDFETGEYVSSATVQVTGLNADVAVTTKTGTQSASASAVLARPAATGVRYDLAYYDAVAGTVGAVSGTDRTTDAGEFLPAVGASTRFPLFSLRVTSSAITTASRWDITNGTPRALTAALDAARTDAKRRLPRFRQRLSRGQSIKIVGFGDSITAIQSTSPDPSSPNGTARDRATSSTGNMYLRDNLGSDLVATVPLYTAVQLGRADDGAGAVHTRVGFNWSLVAALEKVGYTLGTDLTYDNFGMGGYATAEAVSGSSLTTWASSAAALASDLVVLQLGMNELGNTGTEARMVTLIQGFQTAGREVLVVGCPRPRSGTVDSWRYTNKAIERAARYTGAAFVSMFPLYEAEYIGSIGITTADVSSANAINHPGLVELAAIGRELVKTVVE